MSTATTASAGGPAEPDPPVVLVVCTGNVCRSPVAERLLRAALDASAPGGAGRVRVVSAGTGALVGEPMTAEAAELVRRTGGDPDGHRAQQLTPALVRSATLVLAATREHRSAAVRLAPAAVRRSFTLREAGRLTRARGAEVTGADPAQRLTALVPLLTGARGALMAFDPADDDVVDPFGGSPEAWALTEAQLLPALISLVAALRGDEAR